MLSSNPPLTLTLTYGAVKPVRRIGTATDMTPGFPSSPACFHCSHAIVSSTSGPEYYVTILSFVDKSQLEPGCTVLLHNKVTLGMAAGATDRGSMLHHGTERHDSRQRTDSFVRAPLCVLIWLQACAEEMLRQLSRYRAGAQLCKRSCIQSAVALCLALCCVLQNRNWVHCWYNLLCSCCAVLQVMSVVGILSDEADPMVSVMKVSRLIETVDRGA